MRKVHKLEIINYNFKVSNKGNQKSNITIMYILRAQDSFASRILPLSARVKQMNLTPEK